MAVTQLNIRIKLIFLNEVLNMSLIFKLLVFLELLGPPKKKRNKIKIKNRNKKMNNNKKELKKKKKRKELEKRIGKKRKKD